RIEHVPQDLRSERLESVRRLGPAETAYPKVTFHKQVLERDQHADAVLLGPGHPLYAAVDEKLNQQLADPSAGSGQGLTGGVALFTDATTTAPYRLHFLEFEIRGETPSSGTHPNTVLHAELVAVREDADSFSLAPSDTLHDLAPLPTTDRPQSAISNPQSAMDFLKSGYQLEKRLRVQAERQKFAQIIRDYLARSFDARIGDAERRVMALRAREAQGETEVALARQRAESDLGDLHRARSERLNGLERLTIARNGPVRHIATLVVFPITLLRSEASLDAEADAASRDAALVGIGAVSAARQKEIELAAMRIVLDYERARGWEPVDISHIHGPGFDIRSFGPADPATGVRPVRRIEVKGRQRGWPILLTRNEWLKAKQLGESYWLYVVWNPTEPGAAPVTIQNPAQRLEHIAREVRAISHWEVSAEAIVQVGL
ncbi:MAG: DUF3883 domain-containing protein, partial [Anaerolineales bacterium]